MSPCYIFTTARLRVMIPDVKINFPKSVYKFGETVYNVRMVEEPIYVQPKEVRIVLP